MNSYKETLSVKVFKCQLTAFCSSYAWNRLEVVAEELCGLNNLWRISVWGELLPYGVYLPSWTFATLFICAPCRDFAMLNNCNIKLYWYMLLCIWYYVKYQTYTSQRHFIRPYFTFGDVGFGGALTNAFLWMVGEAKEFRFVFLLPVILLIPWFSSTHQTFLTKFGILMISELPKHKIILTNIFI